MESNIAQQGSKQLTRNKDIVERPNVQGCSGDETIVVQE